MEIVYLVLLALIFLLSLPAVLHYGEIVAGRRRLPSSRRAALEADVGFACLGCGLPFSSVELSSCPECGRTVEPPVTPSSMADPDEVETIFEGIPVVCDERLDVGVYQVRLAGPNGGGTKFDTRMVEMRAASPAEALATVRARAEEIGAQALAPPFDVVEIRHGPHPQAALLRHYAPPPAPTPVTPTRQER